MKKLKKLSFNNNFTLLSEAGMKAIMGGDENTCSGTSGNCSNKTCTDQMGFPVGYLQCKTMITSDFCYCQ